MGKVPIRLKEVMYTLSPFEQSVMSGLWKDLPHKAAHHAANGSVTGAGWEEGSGGHCGTAAANGYGASVALHHALTAVICTAPSCLQLRDAVFFFVAPITGIA